MIYIYIFFVYLNTPFKYEKKFFNNNDILILAKHNELLLSIIMVCAYILFLFIFLCREVYYRKEGTIFFSHMLSCITKNE